MKICIECNSEYDELKVSLPQPLPDKMCAVCGTILTEKKIEELKDIN